MWMVGRESRASVLDMPGGQTHLKSSGPLEQTVGRSVA
jgi:hypothetical protein